MMLYTLLWHSFKIVELYEKLITFFFHFPLLFWFLSLFFASYSMLFYRTICVQSQDLCYSKLSFHPNTRIRSLILISVLRLELYFLEIINYTSLTLAHVPIFDMSMRVRVTWAIYVTRTLYFVSRTHVRSLILRHCYDTYTLYLAIKLNILTYSRLRHIPISTISTRIQVTDCTTIHRID